MTDRADVHDRRKERDRIAAAARREESRETGVPMGHALDALLIDALALHLAGREVDDPVRLGFLWALNRACNAREVKAVPVLKRRVQARLKISNSLREAIAHKVDD